jgi:hypothetical protein
LRAGIFEKPKEYRNSSSKDYARKKGLMDIQKVIIN